MEKRFTAFVVLSSLLIFGYLWLETTLHPPRPVVPPDQAQDGAPPPAVAAPDDAQGKPAAGPGQQPAVPPGGEPAKRPAQPKAAEAAEPAPAPQRLALGSIAPDSPFRLLVTLNNRGAAIERIELTQRTAKGRFRYSDLEAPGGYLGHLGLEDVPDGKGCRITIVGAGTPAATAQAARDGVPDGLQKDDVITALDGSPISDTAAAESYLAGSRAGQSMEVTVARGPLAAPAVERFTVQLTDHPLSVVKPEVAEEAPLGQADPLSCLLTLDTIGKQEMPRDALEFPDPFPSLRDTCWQATPLADDGRGPGVEFRFRLSDANLQEIGASGAWEIVKRYRLAPTPADELNNRAFRSYHLTMELEFRNRGDADQLLAYRLDGPNGLPLEGWWYMNKIHPTKFAGAGARDVVWSTPEAGHGLMPCPRIYDDSRKAAEKSLPPVAVLFADPQPHAVDYVGVDAQYFVAALKPVDPVGKRPLYKLGHAIAAGELWKKEGIRNKTTNVTFRLTSQPQLVPAGQTLTEAFELFAGPKVPDLLEQYQLEQCVAYGWFPWVAKPLAWILHFFERLPLVNWGLAIILLTALVRGGMIPLSRKAARNAQVMQELAPEMKKIAEKYKDDPKKRMAAQQELWGKHNHNPLGGCLLMFIQLPIFIGLYRALSVDIELRQAPLIDGLGWCANLAGPDMLWNWKDVMWKYLADEAGWLGPYLNVLPFFTIALFLIQQKMFMPPATDEQTRMQQKMMNIMMVVMGVLFYKVPSGLCVYFIASSIWGIVERKVLPPVTKKSDAVSAKAATERAEKEKYRARLKKKHR